MRISYLILSGLLLIFSGTRQLISQEQVDQEQVVQDEQTGEQPEEADTETTEEETEEEEQESAEQAEEPEEQKTVQEAPEQEEENVEATEEDPVEDEAVTEEVVQEEPAVEVEVTQDEEPQEDQEDVTEETETEEAEPAEDEASVEIETVEVPEATDEQEADISSIDTVDLSEPKGNWLIKRRWWEFTEGKYEKIKQRVAQILEVRMAFFEKHNLLDRSIFDPFYLEMGAGEGSIESLIEEYIQKLETERKEEGSLDEDEINFLKTLREEKSRLELLGGDIKKVQELDDAFNEAITKVLEQVNTAQGYEVDAWNLFKSIARELSDKQARQMYQQMKTISTNVKNILEYLEGPFSQHFQALENKVKQKTQEVKSNLEVLRRKDINLVRQIQRYEDTQEQEELAELIEQEQQEAAQVERIKYQREQQLKKISKPAGWFSMIAGMFASFGETIVLTIKTIWDYSFGLIYNYIKGFFVTPSKVPVKQATQEKTESIVEQQDKKEEKQPKQKVKEETSKQPKQTIEKEKGQPKEPAKKMGVIGSSLQTIKGIGTAILDGIQTVWDYTFGYLYRSLTGLFGASKEKPEKLKVPEPPQPEKEIEPAKTVEVPKKAEPKEAEKPTGKEPETDSPEKENTKAKEVG